MRSDNAPEVSAKSAEFRSTRDWEKLPWTAGYGYERKRHLNIFFPPKVLNPCQIPLFIYFYGNLVCLRVVMVFDVIVMAVWRKP